jgi:hypothetical protein
MLKTIKYKDYTENDVRRAFPELSNTEVTQMVAQYATEILQPGVLITELNFNHSITGSHEDAYDDLIITDGVLTGVIDLYNNEMTFKEKLEFSETHNTESTYGVCDTPEQVIEKFGLDKSELNVTVALTPIKKSDQPDCGGWRWHKWGQYIGDKEITSEYLYDETNIDVVYVYHIFILKD